MTQQLKKNKPTIALISNEQHLSPELITDIVPESGKKGYPTAYYPCDRFPNRQGLSIHEYGEGPFCRFKIPERYRKNRGAYFITVAGFVMFIGWCRDLNERISRHYGTISPKKCYEDNGIENCYINGAIYDASYDHKRIILYFLPDIDEESVNRLIKDYLPEWNCDLINYWESLSDSTY